MLYEGSGISKFIEIESRREVTRGWAGGEWGMRSDYLMGTESMPKMMKKSGI